MIKNKINKMEKAIKEIKKLNRRYVPITHWVNENIYEYDKIKYDTLEELKEKNNVTEEDEVLILALEYVTSRDQIKHKD